MISEGKRKKGMYKDNLPAASTIVMAQKGSMTVGIFLVWLKHFAKFKGTSNTVLLIFNGAKCRDKAEELSVYIFVYN